jgi:predicted alpha-1,2-mannosidase
MRSILAFTSIVAFILCSCRRGNEQLTAFVNPMVGTGGHGHTFPGPVLPFGMVQLSPDTRIDGSWDGCSGYHYSDSVIYGFSHTHLSGTGVSDWGDILLMPVTRKMAVKPQDYRSRFSHATEKAAPGFYSVQLHGGAVTVSLTATQRAGIHLYDFKGDEGHVILDLLHRDRTLKAGMRLRDNNVLTGFRISQAWAREQHVYFAARFSSPFTSVAYSHNRQTASPDSADGACLSFRLNGKPLLVKVAISAVSEEGALKNLDAETRGDDFETYRQRADSAWEKQLSVINVKGDKPKNVFYTALYHACTHPSLYMDVDRNYRGRDNRIHKAEGFDNYSVFSLWDTYRTLHPLLAIIEPKRTADFINTFLAQHEQSGRLPVWELSSNETNCMIGFHAVSVMADAMAKGIKGFDYARAFKAAVRAADDSIAGRHIYNTNGFLQADDESESVSKTLEYAYDNWCVAQMARTLGDSLAYRKFALRAEGWKNLFDPSTGFMRPRKNGNWLSPFDPREVNNHFTEANSWQYSFYVPHNTTALAALHGGPIGLRKKLDALFSAEEKTLGRDQPDISGMMGQYAHGNEPSHHIAFLYHDAGDPDRSSEKIERIQDAFYRDMPDGLTGNEDCGQMSAWYVMTAMGFYPVCPGRTEYYAVRPAFDAITISTPGYTTVINKQNYKAPGKDFLYHDQIVAGGTVTSSPRRPIPVDISVPPAPVIHSDARSFAGSMEISISQDFPTVNAIEYAVNSPTFTSYNQPFVISTAATVLAKNAGASSPVARAVFFRRNDDIRTQILTPPDPQYSADGSISLRDGILGDADWRKGDWIGIQEQDLLFTVETMSNKPISEISLHCLQDSRSWIVYPSKLVVEYSNDGKSFANAGHTNGDADPLSQGSTMQWLTVKLRHPVSAKVLRITAVNPGPLPAGHPGKGGQSYIFADEVKVR